MNGSVDAPFNKPYYLKETEGMKSATTIKGEQSPNHYQIQSQEKTLGSLGDW